MPNYAQQRRAANQSKRSQLVCESKTKTLLVAKGQSVCLHINAIDLQYTLSNVLVQSRNVHHFDIKKVLQLIFINPFATDGTFQYRFGKFKFSFGREGVPRYLWATRLWGVSRIGNNNNYRINVKVYEKKKSQLRVTFENSKSRQ